MPSCKKILIVLSLLLTMLPACAEKKILSDEEALLATIQSLQTQVVASGPGTPTPHGSLAGTPFPLTQQPYEKNLLTPMATNGSTEGQFKTFPLLGQIGGSSYAVTVQGNLAYLGVGPRLVVLDLSQPASPVQIGQSEVFSGIVYDVKVQGDYAYIATGILGGLYIIDIRDPRNPKMVGHFNPTLPGCNGLTLVSNLVYLGCNPYGLRIVDVSEPTNPRELGSLELKRAIIDIDVDRNTAYLVAAGEGMYLVDVSNPVSPSQVGFFPQPERLSQEHPDSVMFNSVDATGDYAYLSTGDAGMAVVDVRNPASPKLAGSFNANVTNGILVDGSTAYLVDEFDGIYLLDVSNPTNPRQVGILPSVMGTEYELSLVTVGARGLAYDAGRLFVSDVWHSLYILNVDKPAEPSWLAHFQAPAPDRLVDVVVSESIAYLIGDSSGLRVIDVSETGNLRELAFDDRRINVTLQTPTAIEWSNNHVFITDANIGFHIYDVSNPNEPIEVGLIQEIGFVHDLYLRGDYAYLATQDWQNDNKPRLLVVNISNPSNPKIVNQVEIPLVKDHIVWSISGEGEYLYMVDFSMGSATQQLFYIYNLSDPISPALSSQPPLTLPATNTGCLYVKDNYLYISNLYPPLQIYSLQNPVLPSLVGQVPLMGLGQDLEKSGNLLFGVPNSLVAYDVSSPNTPVFVGLSQTPLNTFGVTVVGDRIFVVGLDFGLLIYDAR